MSRSVELDGKKYTFKEDINATCDDCDIDITDHGCPKCDGGVYIYGEVITLDDCDPSW